MSKHVLGGIRKSGSVAADIPELAVNLPPDGDIAHLAGTLLLELIRERWASGQSALAERRAPSPATLLRRRAAGVSSSVAFVASGHMSRDTQVVRAGAGVAEIRVPADRIDAVEQMASGEASSKWGATQALAVVDEPLERALAQVLEQALK